VVDASHEPLEGRRGLVGRLAANSLAQVLGTLLASAISFFTFVAVARTLGPAAYGDLAAALVYLFLPAVLGDVGLTATIVRRISAEPAATETLLGASLPLRVLVSLGATGGFVAAAFILPFDHRVRVAVLIASVGTVAALLNSMFAPIFQARLAMHWLVISTVAGRLLTLGLTYAAIAAGLGFKSLVWAAVLGQILTLVVSVLLVIVAMRVRVRPRVDLPYWRTLLRGGIVLGAALAVGQLYFRVDTIVLSLLRTPREVGLYGASYKFLEVAVIGPYAILNSLFPTMSRFLGGQRDRIRPLAQSAFDIGLVVSVPATVLAIAFAGDIISITAGDKYAPGAVALKLLAPYIVATFLLTPALAVLLAIGANRALLLVNVGLLVLNIGLNFVFIPFYGYKVAAVISVASEVVDLVLLTWVAHRRFGYMPSLRAAPVVAAGAMAMVGVILILPAPVAPLAASALAVYAATVVAIPGAVRDVVVRLAGRRATA
jgi:O-antigen/teichoic acid export membrane protein